MTFKEKQKGSSLYLTVIFMGMILVVAVGVTGIVVSGSNLINGMGDSTKAFYVADSGLEKALYEVRKNNAEEDLIINDLDCSSTFSYQYGDVNCNVEICIEDGGVVVCDNTGYVGPYSGILYFKSSGDYNGSIRRLESAY